MKNQTATRALAGWLLLGIAVGPSSASAQYAPSQKFDNSGIQIQTFVGKVTRNHNAHQADRLHFVLYDENRKYNFYLDGLSARAKYQGERVEITGTLDEKDAIIHVQTIKKLK
jgi:hypothetical protein